LGFERIKKFKNSYENIMHSMFNGTVKHVYVFEENLIKTMAIELVFTIAAKPFKKVTCE